MAGLVEDINLFVTSLRNLDGQVIPIPNSKISTAINIMRIEILYDSRLRKTDRS